MKKYTLLCLLLTHIVSAAVAQKETFTEWADNPQVHKVPEQYAGEPAVFILQDVNMDYRYEGRNINVYYTLHRIIKVMDERGIESFNKIELPVYHGTRITSVKARTILPDGKIHELSEDVMKISRNEQGAPELVFAMEGVEKNAEIELLVKEMKPVQLFGTEIFQYPVPILNASFEMAYPKEMVFEEKGYNGFPDVHDSFYNNRRHIKAFVKDIAALPDEKYSYYDRYRMRAEYRVSSYAEDHEKERLFSWDDLAHRLHDEIYITSEPEKKAVNSFLSSIGVTDNLDPWKNVQKIETGIKDGITLYDEIDGDDADNLDSIITKKSATEAGYVKLFAACFSQANVKHELGVTSNREEHSFDGNFGNWAALAEYIFYFPDLNKFLSPTSVSTRCPVLPDEVLGNKGMFCLIPPNGGHVNTALSEIVTIAPLPAKDTREDITATVSFSKEMRPSVDIAYDFTGYAAVGMRRTFAHPQNEKKEVADMISIAKKVSDISEYSILGQSYQNFYKGTPLHISATVSTPQLIEKAGGRYLFKVGDIIGLQAHLYDVKDRKTPIDIPYPHSLTRIITINIPPGYKVYNPETIKLHAEHKNISGAVSIAFNSDYKLKGNQLIITVTEIYIQVHYHADEYADFRNVIDAAADFNKITLLLRK